MSERWPGGIVRATPVTPTGPLQNGTAPGMWTLDQANYWIAQGLWPTAGNFLAVEDVFSTWLYTGTGSAQTITNGINLSGQGGMVWIKQRNAVVEHFLYDTARGVTKSLSTNDTTSQYTNVDTLTAFGSTGFTLGSSNFVNGITSAPRNYASWTFREAPNFFDVVTYTGDGVNARAISHNLGVTPGFIIVKRTNNTGNWYTWHRAYNSGNNRGALNSAGSFDPAAPIWGNGSSYIAPTSTTFTVSDYSEVNGNGDTFVAYLFAHDTSSTGLIQCGSFTAGTEVNLGWEPQWVMIKSSATADTGWIIIDNMRMWANDGTTNGNTEPLDANSSGAEYSTNYGWPTATGFVTKNLGTIDCVYIAIRRGPMRTPTLGTTVFSPAASSAAAGTAITTNFPVDLNVFFYRPGTDSGNTTFEDRLRGMSGNSTDTAGGKLLRTSSTAAETTTTVVGYEFWNTNWKIGSYYGGYSSVYYSFRRAPSFFDEVCYTGTGSARTINHNLGVAPELIITKCRSNGTTAWMTYCSALSSPNDKYLFLNQNSAVSTVAGTWKTPTATTFGMDISFTEINNSGFTYVSYLFASCPGVSKVGSYTGTGTTQTINCGFTTGARFVLIKRTDSTGDWFVWDSARGITSGNDPYLLLNSTAAEVTGTNYVDTDTTGFQVTAAAPAGINANGGSYIFLAIS